MISNMAKTKICHLQIFFLSLVIIFLPGCAYLIHPRETLFLKSLEDNQKAMQAELDREEKLFNKLRTDIDRGRLKQFTQKRRIFSLYGQPVLCRQSHSQTGIRRETCIYRKPGGLSTSIILLNFDTQDKLSSWEINNPDK